MKVELASFFNDRHELLICCLTPDATIGVLKESKGYNLAPLTENGPERKSAIVAQAQQAPSGNRMRIQLGLIGPSSSVKEALFHRTQ